MSILFFPHCLYYVCHYKNTHDIRWLWKPKLLTCFETIDHTKISIFFSFSPDWFIQGVFFSKINGWNLEQLYDKKINFGICLESKKHDQRQPWVFESLSLIISVSLKLTIKWQDEVSIKDKSSKSAAVFNRRYIFIKNVI